LVCRGRSKEMNESFSFRVGLVCPQAGGSPAATHFLLFRQKKVSKEKATPLSASLRFAAGNLRCSVQPGPGSNSLRSDNRPSLSDWTSAPRRIQKGCGDRIGNGFGFGYAIGLRRGCALRVLASPYPNPNPHLFLHPSGWAEERSRKRIRASDCLSVASSSSTPLSASTAGCPQRSEGTRTIGSPFFWVLFFGDAKKSASPAGARPGLQPDNHRFVTSPAHANLPRDIP